MTENNQEPDFQPSPLSHDETDPPDAIPLQEPFFFSQPSPPIDSFVSNQKIEIVFAQGHRLCLQGSFDWEVLRSWLVPLLVRED